MVWFKILYVFRLKQYAFVSIGARSVIQVFAKVGAGVIIGQGANIFKFVDIADWETDLNHSDAYKRTSIGNNVTIDSYSRIHYNVQIGEDTFIGDYVTIGPNSIIGKNCTIEPRAILPPNSIIEDGKTVKP